MSLPAERPVLKLLLLACAPIIVKSGREKVALISYSLPKLKIFRGHLENSGPENLKTLRNNLENARKNFWSKILKLTTLVLLYGLHLCFFDFGKIRSINDGFITERIVTLTKPRKVFWPVAQKLWVASNN